MSKPRNSQGKRSSKSAASAKASRGSAMKDLAPSARGQSSTKGGKRTVVRDANDKYA